MGENLNSNSSDNDNESNYSLKEIFATLARRPKLFLLTTLLFFSGTVAYTIYERIKNPIYRGNFVILLADPIGSEKMSKGGASGFESLAINKTVNDVNLLKLFLKSPYAIQSLADELNISHSYLTNTIKIKGLGGKYKDTGDMIEVTISIKDKKLGEKIVKRLSQIYLDLAVDFRQKRLSDGLKFLDIQSPAIQKKNKESTEELSAFREKYGVLDPLKEGDLLYERIGNYEDDVFKTNLVVSNLKKIKKDIKNNSVSTKGFRELFDTETDFLSLKISTVNKNILDQAEKLEQKLTRAKAKYTNNSEMVRNLENKLNEMESLITEAQISSVNTALKIQEDLLVSYKLSLKKLKDVFAKQALIIKEYNEIQQRLNLNKENLLSLSEARETFRLEIAQKTAPWTIISPPKIYSKPTSPNFVIYLSYGAIISLILGSIITFIRDKIDNKYHDADQIIKDLETISLGLIPHVSAFDGVREDKRFLLDDIDTIETSNKKPKGKNKYKKDSEDLDKNYQRFFYQEAFRNVITSLRFLQSDQEIKTITITSSIPAEGKSLINILLSKTYSELDKKVLLIDADLRKPQLHVRLGLNNILGLSNILTDSSLELNNVIQKIDGFDNWDVITAGITPPDPTRLLSSEKMNRFISNLKNSGDYDIIIFDTPPVIGLADASLIAEKTDGSILLVTTEKVPIGLPKEAKNIMIKSGTEFLGVLINSIKKNRGKLSAYGVYGYNAYDVYSNYSNKVDKEPKEGSKDSIKNKIKSYLTKFFEWIEN
tara:strand:- start:10386 stop:12692 length:2307 start_codon:yes stop_codon:yes gene_type:complete